MIESSVVSIICLNYNQEKNVQEALHSVLAQSYENIELIILDDCSTDNSVIIIEEWLKNNKINAKFVKNNSNQGVTKSFNNAVSFCSGKYLFDFASDDLLLPDTIQELVTKFESSTYTNLGLVYANLENIDEDGHFISYYFDTKERPNGYIFEKIIDSGKTICSPTALISSKVFKNLKGYDESLMYEDLDFWIRLSRDYEIDYLDKVLVKKRKTSNSLGEQFHSKIISKKINTSTYKILKKAFSLCKSKTEFRALLRRIHYEIGLNFKLRNFRLLCKLLFLKLKIHLKN